MQRFLNLGCQSGARAMAIVMGLALPAAPMCAPPPAQRAIPPNATLLNEPTSSLHIAHRPDQQARFKDWVVLNRYREVTRGIVEKATLEAADGSMVAFAGEVKFDDSGLVSWGVLASDSSLRAVGPEKRVLTLRAGTYAYFVPGSKRVPGGVLRGVLSVPERFTSRKGESVKVPAGNAILLDAEGQLVGWARAGDTD